MSHNIRLIVSIEDVDVAWTRSVGLGFAVARALTESKGFTI